MGKTLFGEVLSGYLIDVPNLVEEKLSDKALDRGLGRWVHEPGSEKAKSFTTKVSKMVSHLMENSVLGKIGSYSRSEKRWFPWRATKRALHEEKLQKLQKEEEEVQMQGKQQVERLVHPKPEHPPASETNVKKTLREENKRLSELSDEENTTNFLNAIGNNIREMHGVKGLAFDACVFSPRFRHRSPTDAAVDCIRKPDVVVLERWAADAPDATWRDIKTLLEIKYADSKESQRDAFLELLHCVRMVFAAQVNRRFVMGATICGDKMTFCIFDRSGCLASESFNINENVERVVRVVCGMLFVDEVRLGYDPTIFRGEDGQIVVKFKGVEYKCAEDPLYVEKCVRGRGTGCFETVYFGEPAVIKDAWVDDSRSKLEHEILDKVKDVEGVVKVVDYEIVQVPDEDDVLVNDTTSECRKTLMKDNLWTTNAKWSGFHLVETRTHRRIMLQPCGAPLEGFANLSELLLAIKDIVKCVQDLLEKKVLHRDISLRNIILAKANPKDANSRMRAYLIDFDYALDLENQSQAAAKGARTGTLPFMALEMLAEETSNRVKHAYYHDLESIFYVLCWLCTSQEGPNNTERDHRTFDFNKSEVAKWAGIGKENSNLDDIRRCKAATIRDESEFTEKVLGDFAPYFDPIKPYVLALRDVMVNEGSNNNNPLYLLRLRKRMRKLEEEKAKGRPIDAETLKDIPNSHCKPAEVFQSIFDIIEDALEDLVEPPLPPACTPDAKARARARAEEEARKEAKRMKFRKHMSIREMQEGRGINLRIKENKAKDVTEGVERKERKMDKWKGLRAEEESCEPTKDPEHRQPICATSDRNSLMKQAALNTLVTLSSVPGLTHSGPSDSASGTDSGSPSRSPPSLMPTSRIGQPSTMKPIGSKRAVNDNDDKSKDRCPAPKKAKKCAGLG